MLALQVSHHLSLLQLYSYLLALIYALALLGKSTIEEAGCCLCTVPR